MIVVTGGAGFIGSAFVKRLNSMGIKNVLVVDNLGISSKWQNLNNIQFNDFINKNEIFSLFNKSPLVLKEISAIVHMGACSSTTERDVDYLMANNYQCTKDYWNLCADHSIPLIYASSAATYGNGEVGYSDDPEAINKLRPINPYGYSKQAFDLWTLSARRRPPFWAGLKFFNVFGPNEYHKDSMMSLVCKAVPQILENGSLKLFKSHKEGIAHGEQKRDFVYIKDVVDVLMHFYSQPVPGIQSGIYNLGTGKARSFGDLGRATFKALGIKENIEWVDMPEEIRSQYQYFTEADLTRLRTLGRYTKPFQDLETSVDDYVKNYLVGTKKFL
jgi:ADP-L-glycero-D-manno-heptose 6-epimerase